MYEDYLVPELKALLNKFRAYVYDLQYGEAELEVNAKQQEAINKATEFEEKKMGVEEQRDMDKVQDEVRRLKYVYPDQNARAGFVATMQVVAFIVGAAIVLTAITLYLLS